MNPNTHPAAAAADPFDVAVFALVDDLQRAQGPRQPEMRAYNPGLLDRVGAWMMGDSRSPERARLVSGLVGTTGLGQQRASVADVTGLPTIERGVGHIMGAAETGDVMRAVGGAGEVAMGALPALGTTRAAAPMMNMLMGSVPRSVGTTAGLGAATLPMQIDDARAQASTAVDAAVLRDPEVQRLRQAIEAKEAERRAAMTQPIPGLNRASADAAREQLGAAIQADITALGEQFTAARERARSSYASNAPFRERHPDAAGSLMTGGATLAAALPFANTIKRNLANRLVYDPSIARNADRVERALGPQTSEPGLVGRMLGRDAVTTPPDKALFLREQDTLQRRLGNRDSLDTGRGTYLGNSVGGALVMQEARMIPEEVDAFVFPHEHPARKAALNALVDPYYYISGAVPSIIGGATAASIGTAVGDVMSRRTVAPDLDRARMLANVDFKTKAPRPEPPREADSAGPGRTARIADAMTNRLVQWIEPRPAPAGQPQATAGAAPAPQPPLPVGGGPEPQQARPPRPQRGPANPSQAYRDPQKAVVRPLVETEVAAGRNVPDKVRVGQELGRSGLDPQIGPTLAKRLDAAQTIVSSMRQQGMDDRRIAAVLADLMRANMHGLPAIAAGSIGGGMALSQATPDY